MTIHVVPARQDARDDTLDKAEYGGLRALAGADGFPRASFLQTPFWGEFKRAFGWKDRLFSIEWRGELSTLLVLERKIAGIFTFAYVPDGPALGLPEGERAGFLAELSRALRAELSSRCLFIRFDPPWALWGELGAGEPGAVPGLARPSVGKPLVRAASDVQPPDTVLLDLGLGVEELLAAMKPKWRYNIRLAEKKGVEIEEACVGEKADKGLEAVGRFYRLYELTARRDRIALHPRAYYERLAALAAEAGSGADLRIWIARHDGEDLAAIITLFMNGRAVYLYGASSDQQRNLMPAYALQWAAIRAAHAFGCIDYDFYGIPPTDDPGHPMAGLYRFKTGFGGSILHKAGSWDYPCRKLAYTLFRFAELGRVFWYKKVMKKLKRSDRQESKPESRAEASN